MNKLAAIFADIKIQHTVFALPFAVMSAFLAAQGMPPARTLFWIVAAMFGARCSAMAFNRIVDASFDKVNPRTRGRLLPSGRMDVASYWRFLGASAALFIFASGMLNRLALGLSPVALGIVFFYSLTKRFTSWSHLFLGLALAVAPVGAWIAVREEVSVAALVLGAAVIFWLAGFDIIYACQDARIDARLGLYSAPRAFGVKNALRLARGAHVLMLFFLALLPYAAPLLGVVYAAGVALVAALLFYEHRLVWDGDLSRINAAFFTANGWVSMLLMLAVVADCIWF